MSERKKVLFITPSLCQGGVEHSLITMLKSLDLARYDVTLFTYRANMTLLPLVPEGVRVINDIENPHHRRRPMALCYAGLEFLSEKLHVRSVRRWSSVKRLQYLRRQRVLRPSKVIFKGEQFDTVVSNAIGASTEMALYIEAKKRIVFYHSSMDMHHEMLEKVLPCYQRIVGVSEGVCQMLAGQYPHIAHKLSVLKNYVDANKILSQADEPVPVERGGKLVLCTCGRFSDEKGFDLAVESANLLQKQGVDFIWYFVGDGANREKIEKLIQRYELQDCIVITGYTENPFPYMKNCDVYVQPSYHESFGLTIKEAVILGRPVVSTDTVGGKTVLEKGRYGELVPVSEEGLAEGILRAKEKADRGDYARYDVAQNQAEKETYLRGLEELLEC